MKGKKRASGGEAGQGERNDAEADVKDKPMDYTADNKVSKEAEEMKKGGRTKKATGGVTARATGGAAPAALATGGRAARKSGGKTEMKMHGDKAKEHAGRMPRKNGGRTGSDSSPFTSARYGKAPQGHSFEKDSSD
jgi:hypothetical protein